MAFLKKRLCPQSTCNSLHLFLANFVIRIISISETAAVYYFDIMTVILASIALAISIMAFSIP